MQRWVSELNSLAHPNIMLRPIKVGTNIWANIMGQKFEVK